MCSESLPEFATLYRISDGQPLTQNDDGTWSFVHQRVSMPTTYYRYTLDSLLNTGEFEFS